LDVIYFHAAWTTAAVDNERVIGAIPIVMDILNIHQVKDQIRFILY
jgi:PhoPQ-activated pathogenicity-related protein